MNRDRDSIAALKVSGLSSSLLKLMKDLPPPCSPRIHRAHQAAISYPSNVHPTLVSQQDATGTADRSPRITWPVLPRALLSSSCSLVLVTAALGLCYQVTIWISNGSHSIARALNPTSVSNLVTRGKLGVKCYPPSTGKMVHDFYWHKMGQSTRKLDQKF